jgi:hypothetical protein
MYIIRNYLAHILILIVNNYTRNYKKHICGLQSIINKRRICGTEGETIEHIISSWTVLAQSEYKKRHDIFAKIIHMNLAVKFNLLKITQPHYNINRIMLCSTVPISIFLWKEMFLRFPLYKQLK